MNDNYICWLSDQDGETRGSQEFETLEELLYSWPYAELECKSNPLEYTSWIGGRR
jgi:hypothetical protein